MIITFKREGRVVKNIGNGKDEKILTTYINGRRIMRGTCDNYFRRVTGIKIPVGGTVHLRVAIIPEKNMDACPSAGECQ